MTSNIIYAIMLEDKDNGAFIQGATDKESAVNYAWNVYLGYEKDANLRQQAYESIACRHKICFDDKTLSIVPVSVLSEVRPKAACPKLADTKEIFNKEMIIK